VLAGPGLDRELGYTALSRGRETNHLYAARDPDTMRVEYAPTDPHRTNPIARLVAQLQTSSTGTLAVDVGRESRASVELGDAQRELALAAAARRAAENSRGGWLPHRRAKIEELRATENRLARRVETLRRQDAEQHHGERPFVEDRDDHTQYREMTRRIAERRLEREQTRDLGRGLER
jgi:hypothetical protein